MIIRLRTYQPSDRARCAAIFHRAWAVAFPHIPRVIDETLFDEETLEERVFVAEVDGIVQGFAALYEPDAFLHHLYIEPALHRAGIGRALLDAVRGAATEPLSLKCSLSNTNARAFYAHFGFTEGERGIDHFGEWVRLTAPQTAPPRDAA